MALFKKRPPLKLRVDNPSAIELRPYSKDTDYQAVIDVVASRYPEVGLELDLSEADKGLTDIDRYWRKPGGEFMVIARNNIPIGTISVRPSKTHRGHADFDWFFLAKNEEAKGFGLLMLKWGFQWCLEHKIRIIELWSNEHRKTVHKLYRKIGFEDMGVRKLYRSAPEEIHQLYFELNLEDPQKLKGLEQMTQSINF